MTYASGSTKSYRSTGKTFRGSNVEVRADAGRVANFLTNHDIHKA